jgi:hypothetical protein
MALPILAIMALIESGASLGTGLYQYSQNEEARDEARSNADTLRGDTLKQQKIGNRQTNQQMSNQRQAMGNQAEVNSMQTASMDKKKSDADFDNKSDILRMGREQQEQKSLSNLQSRLGHIGGRR